MNKTEHLLACLTEECAEVQKATAKALRFGLSDVHPSTNNTNSSEVYEELVHVIAVAEMLSDLGVLKSGAPQDRAMIDAKKEKVTKWMEHAIQKGTLEKSEAIFLGWNSDMACRERIVEYIKTGGFTGFRSTANISPMYDVESWKYNHKKGDVKVFFCDVYGEMVSAYVRENMRVDIVR